MAVASPSTPQTLDPNPDAGNSSSSTMADSSSAAPPAPTAAAPASAPPEAIASNPANPIPSLVPVAPPPPAVPSFAPSFRPLGAPAVPQYSAVPIPMAQNPAFQSPMTQTPVIQPPGVSAPAPVMPPGSVPGSVPAMRPGVPYQVAPGQPPAAMPYGQVGNGYMAVPPPQGPMGIPPPGMPRYLSPYPTMIRPGFPPRPIHPAGVIPQLPRPPIPNIRGILPVVSAIRPAIPIVAPAEKPQTTVYVGKIASTVENEFLLSVLTLCGPVKSWKRAQDPSDGKPKGFGFCEFETAEGVLRSLRLLSKLNIDGQELVVNINQATREYLQRYVKQKMEKEKPKGTESGGHVKENDTKEGSELIEVETKKDSEDKEDQESNKKFGLVTDEDHEADRDALEKLTGMIEERLKTKPLPPPVSVDGSSKSTSEVPSKLRDGDSDVDITRSDAAEDKNDDETTSENKPATESDKPDIGSPDRSRKHDSRSRERDREKREKERELERVEREQERERIRRERERDLKLREAERLYKDRLKEWEGREREKEYQRQYEKEREKERERERRKEILRQEEESSDDDDDGDSRKRRRRSSLFEERRRKRLREKEEDLDDRLREAEEIAEAKRRVNEEQQLKLVSKPPDQVMLENENQNPAVPEEGKFVEGNQMVSDQTNEVSADGVNNADSISRNSGADDHTIAPAGTSETIKQNDSAPTRKLGFGLIGSGKRTTVPSVFHEEDDEDVDEKKMRPLVPIDYSTEELQAVQTNVLGPQPNLVAAAEFAKRISGVNVKEEKSDMDWEWNSRSSDKLSVNIKEEKPDVDRERNMRSSDKLNARERDRNDDESSRSRDESKMHENNVGRERNREGMLKAENKKLFDAKQLIDMIPKTKEELFVYKINWDTFDKHGLHERLKPWISRKITEFLGEEEPTLVSYIVSCIKDHVQASTMLEMLQSILDDEAEMFVLKIWRMLIFEIKKVETGIAMPARS